MCVRGSRSHKLKNFEDFEIVSDLARNANYAEEEPGLSNRNKAPDASHVVMSGVP